MPKKMYRYEVITQDHLTDGRCAEFTIHPDVFFDTEQKAQEWGAACSYTLEKSKSGVVKIVVRDADNKVVTRIAQTNLTDYELDIVGGSRQDRMSFQEIFEGLTPAESEKKKTSIPLTLKSHYLQSFNLRSEKE